MILAIESSILGSIYLMCLLGTCTLRYGIPKLQPERTAKAELQRISTVEREQGDGWGLGFRVHGCWIPGGAVRGCSR